MILLRDIWNIQSPASYKLHFARWNKTEQPLEVLVRNDDEWQGWQEYYPDRDEFNRQFIFAMARFYHEPEAWLFGGVYEVLGRTSDQYNVRLTDQGSAFIRRLKLKSSYGSRPVRVNFENHYEQLEVLEVMPASYAGRAFPGFDDIDLSFDELETLVRRGRPDWRAALQSVKGIYLITDIKTGRRYVGSAYGDFGVWSRWCEYVESGHGGNAELRTLVNDPSLQYVRVNFRFALLEHRSVRTPDSVILARETFWKNILLSRGEYGMNRN